MATIKRPYLIWVNPASLSDKLDAATWLQTTSELRRLGWQVTLVSYGNSDCQSIRGVEVFCIEAPQIYLLRQVIFHVQCLWLILRHWHVCDVILFHAMSTPWMLMLLLLRNVMRRQRPLFAMDIRTLHMEPPGKESLKDRARKLYHRIMIRLANHWNDGNLAITQRMADVLDIPPEKLWGIWPSGVDMELFAGAWHIRHWPIPGEPVNLIYIGSLNYERNLMAMSRAVVMANHEGMQLKLKLVGSGTGEEELRAFADTTSGSVEVEPSVSHSMVPPLLAKAHVGVLPFPDEEKFRVSSPIKLFEYMAAGLPILATRIACHSDVMDNNDGVFWADGSDEEALLLALRNLWHARDELRWRGQQSLDLAQEWTWSESARKLKAALEAGLARYPVSEPAK